MAEDVCLRSLSSGLIGKCDSFDINQGSRNKVLKDQEFVPSGIDTPSQMSWTGGVFCTPKLLCVASREEFSVISSGATCPHPISMRNTFPNNNQRKLACPGIRCVTLS